MDSKKEKEKYKNAILYFAKYLTPHQLGKTKLAKLLYYLDFISYRDNRESVTGALYYKQEYGPLAQDLTEVIGILVADNKLEVERVITEEGKKQKDQFRAIADPNEKVFSAYEQGLLRRLVNVYADIPTETIVAKSHLEAPWVKAKNGGVLDYELAPDIEDFDPEAEEEAREEGTKVAEAVNAELANR
jgi:uncharacterized phage-associated protein